MVNYVNVYSVCSINIKGNKMSYLYADNGGANTSFNQNPKKINKSVDGSNVPFIFLIEQLNV